jgi:hypothetical protein
MRSDRLKQVMQEIDSTFDEKDLGMAKFSRFAQEAAQRGLIRVTKLENGQMEIDMAGDGKAVVSLPASTSAEAAPRPTLERGGESADDSARRGRRGRGGRGGRGREREPRVETAAAAATPTDAEVHFSPSLEAPVSAPPAVHLPAARAAAEPEMVGERLTRDEALSLLKRAVAELTTSEDAPVPASAVRRKARELLGRDSETLDERFFLRILRDAHDADVIDLRKRGDDYEVAPAAAVASVADQLAAAAPVAPEPSQSSRSAANAASLRRGMRGRVRGGELPPELLSLGVIGSPAPVDNNSATASSVPALVLEVEAEPEASTAAPAAAPAKRGRAPAKTARAKKTGAPAAASAEKSAAKPKRPRAKKTAGSTES